MPKKLSHSKMCSLVYPDEPVVKSKLPVVGYPQVVQKVVDGKVTNQVEFVVDDSRDVSKMTASDFALENLLAAGADLKPVNFAGRSLASIDRVVKSLSKSN